MTHIETLERSNRGDRRERGDSVSRKDLCDLCGLCGCFFAPAAVRRPGIHPGEQLNWRTARPELVDQPSRFALRRSAVASAKAEGRADCSVVRQVHPERAEGLTTSGRSANAT